MKSLRSQFAGVSGRPSRRVTVPCPIVSVIIRRNGSRRNGSHDGRHFMLQIEPAQHTMARRRIRQVNESPWSDLDGVAAVLTDDARTVLVRAKILLLYGRMEERRKELAVVPIVLGRDAGGVSEA